MLSTIEHLVLDEADRLLEEQFVLQIDDLIAACSHPNRRIYLLSATMLPSIEELANTVLKDPIRIQVGIKNTASKNVSQELIYSGTEEGKLIALKQLINKGIKPPVLIFVQSKERAQQLFRELVFEDLNVDMISADRTNAQRMLSVEAFKTGKIWFLITTDLLARGMDFKGVNVVINYDLPTTSTAYIHRIGRTGRMGRDGLAITYYSEEDIPNLRPIVNVIKQSGQKVPKWLLSIDKLKKKDQKN